MTTDERLADFEKLGAFYLGRTVAPPPAGQAYLYDSRHLTTHAVVIGMTGSGKTGLSIALLEEAAIDGIPAIVVDPKGDLGNLLLTFPHLAGEDFAPWVPEGASAEDEARKWREGLAAWGQDGARIERLKSAAEVVLYTPGSRAGRPLSITGSLAAPPPEARADEEAMSERIGQVATSLLGLVGIQAEPGKSREHVLVATILQKAWAAGEDLDLAGLVLRIQDPPFDRLGVLGLESFFPKKERFELAVAYNALLATPGFDAWTAGPPLDINRMLWTKEGKPRISILSIAHLGDSERMFFVSLLLGQMLAWMRTQPGTPSLRALFFMDEVVGYFPPVAMPPSKRPLLVLLKQARAFGLGIVLATQNPVDLDYKGLANAGTWMIGRLQTERDKARVLEGLEGVSQGGSGQMFDRDTVDRTLSGLAKRNFYIHDVHAEGPTVIESRWTMSYLRGPLTRDEIRRLGAAIAPAAAAPAQEGTVVMPAAPAPAVAQDGSMSDRPVLPPDVPQVFFPTTVPRPLYRPMLVGAARVHFEDARTGLDFSREVVFVTPIVDGPLPVRWEDAKWAGGIDVRTLANEPAPGARFMPPPAGALVPKSYVAWSKELAKWLGRTQGVARLKSPRHKLFSAPGEDERAFRARLAQLGRESRDEDTAEVREKLASKLATLEERIRRKQESIARNEEQVGAQRIDAAVSAGGGIFDAFLGRHLGRNVVRGAVRAARSASRASNKAQSVARDKEDLAALYAKHAELQRQAQESLAKVASAHDPSTIQLETVVTKPKKTGITVHLVALAWRADTV
jgi:Helicase HerA, central domain